MAAIFTFTTIFPVGLHLSSLHMIYYFFPSILNPRPLPCLPLPTADHVASSPLSSSPSPPLSPPLSPSCRSLSGLLGLHSSPPPHLFNHHCTSTSLPPLPTFNQAFTKHPPHFLFTTFPRSTRLCCSLINCCSCCLFIVKLELF